MSRTRRFLMTRTRRISVGLAATAAGAVMALGPLTAAHAAGATFRVGNGYISAPQQVPTGVSVAIYNGDRVAHHIVSYNADSPWGLNVVIQPGRQVVFAFGSPGTYDFRDANRSTLDQWGGCAGACSAVSVA
jgi:plastocyanin